MFSTILIWKKNENYDIGCRGKCRVVRQKLKVEPMLNKIHGLVI